MVTYNVPSPFIKPLTQVLQSFSPSSLSPPSLSLYFSLSEHITQYVSPYTDIYYSTSFAHFFSNLTSAKIYFTSGSKSEIILNVNYRLSKELPIYK